MRVFVFILIVLTSLNAQGEEMTQAERIKNVFQTLRAENIEMLDDFYAKDLQFVDPLGEHRGREAVKNYYAKLYKNVKSIKFEPQEIISNENRHVYVWVMKLKAEGLNGGEEVVVHGNSVIHFNESDKVFYHRDYFDMGEFVYEKVPIVGWIIEKIKGRFK